MTASTKIDEQNFGAELTSLLAICLDINTPEETRIILRNELKELKLEIDKILSEE